MTPQFGLNGPRSVTAGGSYYYSVSVIANVASCRMSSGIQGAANNWEDTMGLTVTFHEYGQYYVWVQCWSSDGTASAPTYYGVYSS
jgi:hypothetical protein